jgi:hypothetical protein
MSNRNEAQARAGCRAATLRGLAVLAVLVAPLAWAGRVDIDRQAAVPRPVAEAPAGYQLRCWQYGQLLFEQRNLDFDDATLTGLQLRGLDRRRRSVILTDTGNATCLIRSDVAPGRR